MSNKAKFSVSKYSRREETPSKYQDKSESEIWDDFRKGSRSALVYIYQVFGDDLFTYGFQFSKDKDAIKDYIQDLFLYLNSNSSKLGPTNSIKFYLFRSLRRLIAKETKKHFFLSFFSKPMQGHFNIDVSHETLLIKEEDTTWQLLRLKKAINKLPLRQKEIIYYFFYEGFSYTEIQSIMDYKDINTVRKLQYRAIKSLRADLGDPALTVKGIMTLTFILFQFI